MAKILFIDDNEDQLRLSKKAFERYDSNIEVYVAKSVEEAFDLLDKEEIQVIFVDYALKGSNGIKFIKELSMNGVKIPAVLITGRGDEKTAVEAMKAGAYDYVTKDVGYFDVLPHVYKKVLEKYHAEKEIEKVQQRLVEFNERLLLTNSIIKELNEDLNLNHTAKVFLDGAIRITGADSGLLTIYEGDKHIITIQQGIELPEQLVKALLLETEGLNIYNDLSKDESIFSGLVKYNVRSLINAPLSLLENHRGAIFMMSDLENVFTETDLRSLDILFDSGCASLRNSLLFQIISRSQKFWQETFDAISDIIFAINDQQEIIKCNRAFAEMLGIDIKKVIGKRVDELEIEHPLFYCCKKYINERKSGSAELSHGGIQCIASTFLTNTPEGERIKIFVVKDVTELRRLKEQLYHADKLASIGQLVSGVAHEINNPLTGILGYTELLKMKVKDEALVAELNKIYKAAERCKRIVENLLTFSRQKPPERTFVDINELIDSAIELRVYWLRSNNIEVIREYGANLPAMFVDPQQLQQVFINLIVNAEYAVLETKKENRWIKIRTYKKSDDRVCLEFQDNGVGIPEDSINRIFDPFFTTKPVDKGSGLGLSISHGIIKEHNGEIRVESTPGEGTTFFIELPVKSL